MQMHPKHYRVLLVRDPDYVEGVSAAVRVDHEQAQFTIARNAPLKRVMPEVFAAIHQAYARANLARVPVLGLVDCRAEPKIA